MHTKIIDKSQEWLNENEQAQATRNIWLAGLGLYSKSIEEAKSQQEKNQVLFDELVAKGREVETKTRSTIEQTNANVDARVKKLFSRLNITAPIKDVDAIDTKLD